MIDQTELEKSVISESVKSIFHIVQAVLKWAGTEIKDAVLLEKAAREYLDRYLQRHGLIKALGMKQPVPLREIYTEVQFLGPDELHAFEDLEQLEKAFAERDEGELDQLRKRVDGISVANKERFLNILGQPGAGKTTFMRRIGLEALMGRAAKMFGGSGKASQYHFHSIPVFIELKALKLEHSEINQLVDEEFLTCGFPPSFSTAALKRGDLLILLDGIDEVPSDKLEESIRQIRDFVDRYGKNRFITSCRTAFYKSWLTRFTDVVIADFNNTQIEHFIHNWFRSPIDIKHKTADQCWTLLSSRDHTATLELARRPLLLTFLCLVYNRTQGFPSNRSSLYRRALTIMLEEWAAEKRVIRSTIYRGLHSDLELVLLAQIAGPTFIEGKLFFSRDELLAVIGSFLRDELSAPKNIDSGAVLSAIEVEQGLLIQRTHGTYSFSHLTLHEFLAAYYIHSEERTSKIVPNLVKQPRWREVALLLAGLGKADGFLLRMADEIAKMSRDSETIAALLEWASEITEAPGSEPRRASRRVVAVLFRADLDLEILQRQNETDLCDEISFDAIERLNILRQALEAAALKLDASSEKAISLALLLSKRLQPLERVAGALASKFDVRISFEHILRVCRELSNEGVFAESVIRIASDRLAEQVLSSKITVTTAEDKLQLFETGRLAILTALRVPTPQRITNSPRDLDLLTTIVNGCELVAECRHSALSVTTNGWDVAVRHLLTGPTA
jgi:hypothetical protein